MTGVHKAQFMLAEGADLFRPFLNPGYTGTTVEDTESEVSNDHSDIGDPDSDCDSDFD